jgi:hypothetical protein
MLPWLFGVLLVINLVLFYWGYQQKQSLEPELPPLPQGRYEIRLLSEAETPTTRQQPGEARAGTAGDSGGGDIPSEDAPSADPGKAANGTTTADPSDTLADRKPMEELTGAGADRAPIEDQSQVNDISPATGPIEPLDRAEIPGSP